MVNRAGAYAVGIIVPVVATLFLAGKLIAKRAANRSFGVDGFMLTLGLLVVWTMCGIFLYGVVHGAFGTHTLQGANGRSVLQPQDILAVELEFAFILLEPLAFGIIKMAIVFWYRTIFVRRVFKIASLIMLCFLAAWTLTFFLVSVLWCGAQPALPWRDPLAATTACTNSQVARIAFTVTDVFTDFCVLAIPVPEVLQLQMSTARKVAAITTFMLGLLSTASGIARMSLWIWVTYTSDTSARDFRGLLSTVLTWSLVSAGAAIVGACLPTLRPLTRLKAIEGLLRSTKKSMRSFASKDTLHPRDDSLPAVDISARDETSMEETRARRMTEASLYQEQKQQPAPAG